MAIRGSVEHGVARPDAQKDLPASHSATQSMTLPQQDQRRAEQERSKQEKQVEQALAGSVEHVARASALLAGGAVLVAIGFFAAGFMRRPIEQTVRRLADRLEGVELPLVLPATIAETIREVRANSRIMAEMRAD
jgi:hypothetical protein